MNRVAIAVISPILVLFSSILPAEGQQFKQELARVQEKSSGSTDHGNTPESTAARKENDRVAGSQRLRVVMSETTVASLKSLSDWESRLEGLNMGMKFDINDIKLGEITNKLNQALLPLFPNAFVGSNQSDTGHHKSDLTMIFDLRLTLPKMVLGKNIVQISGTFIDAKGKVIHSVVGSGTTTMPFLGFSRTNFPQALTVAFTEFSKNLNSATQLRAISSSTSSLPIASTAGKSKKVETLSEGTATTSPAGANKKRSESDTAASTSFASSESKNAMSQDEAQSLLEGKGPPNQTDIPSGIYQLETKYTFNVLDSVYYDASNDQLSLIGHLDNRFSRRRIPYLQHLGTLLESPKPQFSLTWTSDSEKRINGLFARHLSQSESDSITDKWGELYDKEGNLTKAGKYLLPALGVSPIFGNQLPGSMGVDVAREPNTLYVRVSKVAANSPAAKAGLQVGDIIKSINATPPFSPEEFDHFIRLRGAGDRVPTEYIHSASGKRDFRVITLEASDDHNVWRSATDQFAVARALYFAAGNNKAGQCIDMLGTTERVKAKYRVPEEVSNNMETGLYYMLGLWDDVVAARKAGKSDAVIINFTTKFCGALDETFGFDGHPVMNAFTQAIRGGDKAAAVNAVMAEFKRHFVPKLEALLNPIFERPEGLQIPPELVEDQFHIHPEMEPQYLGVDNHSLLARTMFSSDYLCKRLMNRPELKQTIPSYQTAFEFEVKHPEFRHSTGNYRIWISVDKMDTPQSADRKTLAFRDVRMRFNIRDETRKSPHGAGKDLPNKPGNYEELLTSAWDSLEQEYPTLHELRESAKLAAAAKWILAQNSSATLPKEGRVSWQGPSKVPGLVFFEIMSDASRATKSRVIIIADGGVSLVPFPRAGTDNLNVNVQRDANPFPSDSSVVDLGGLGLTPTLFTHERQDSLASQIFHKKIAVSEFHPAGWVKYFAKGQNMYDSVSVAVKRLKGMKPQDAEHEIQLREKLDRIQQVSLHLAQTEHAINTLDEKNTNQVHEFQALQKEITEDRDNFYEHFFSFAEDTMLGAKSSLKYHREIAETAEFASEVEDDINYFEDLKASIQSGSASMASLEAAVAHLKRFSEDLQKVSGRLDARNAGRYFKMITKAKEVEDILWMEAGFAKLNFITEVKVENMQNSNDATRAALKDKLLPLQKHYSDKLDSLCNDSQIKAFVAEKNDKASSKQP